MGDVVCDGTSFSCQIGTSQLEIKVLSSSSEGESQKLANTGNFMFTPPPGGFCKLPGVTPPPPCTPPSVSVLDPGQSPVEIDGKKALGAGCKLLCAMAPIGVLEVASSGQSSATHGGAGTAKAVDKVEAPIVIDIPVTPVS